VKVDLHLSPRQARLIVALYRYVLLLLLQYASLLPCTLFLIQISPRQARLTFALYRYRLLLLLLIRQGNRFDPCCSCQDILQFLRARLGAMRARARLRAWGTPRRWMRGQRLETYCLTLRQVHLLPPLQQFRYKATFMSTSSGRHLWMRAQASHLLRYGSTTVAILCNITHSDPLLCNSMTSTATTHNASKVLFKNSYA
jgi:hypothetical protein